MGILASGLPDLVCNDEDLSRFLTSSRYYNTTMVKGVAFLPSLADRESSVFRHASEPLDRLISLGKTYAAGDRNLHGAAIIKTSVVREVGLEVRADEPPPFHAAISGWPSASDPDLELARHKELANVLASASLLVRFGEVL